MYLVTAARNLDAQPAAPTDNADSLAGFVEFLGGNVDGLTPAALLDELERFLKQRLEGKNKASASVRLSRGGVNRLVDVMTELERVPRFRAASFSERHETACKVLARLRG
jgi:hypothetical protein